MSVLAFGMSLPIRALQPPGADTAAPGAAQIAFAESLGNHHLSPQLAERAQWKLQQAHRTLAVRSGRHGFPVQQQESLIPPQWTGMPSTGEPKVLALLCDFADQRAADVFPGMTQERVQANLFGQGTAEAQVFAPWDSLRNYYARASNDRLLVDGTVLGWYHFANAQTDYQPLISGDNKEENWELIKEVLLAYDEEVDFSEFDNDGDGVVDSLNFFWVGETGPWSSFWWGYRWNLRGSEADNFSLDGVRFEDFSWQWVESREADPSDYDPRVIIHEFGHLLGLPDLYDYYPGIGPEGGTGRFDVMDSSRGANHNAFFRWILGWIDPVFATAGDPEVYTLNAAGLPGSTGNAVVIFLPDEQDSPD